MEMGPISSSGDSEYLVFDALIFQSVGRACDDQGAGSAGNKSTQGPSQRKGGAGGQGRPELMAKTTQGD